MFATLYSVLLGRDVVFDGPTKTGVSFTWEGASEYDPIAGTGSAKLGKDGRLKGTIKIKNGDSSTFVAERTNEPDEPIAEPPSYMDKWRRGRR
jgi:hypothetical protein